MYCDGTAVQLEDGTIVAKKPHRHDAHGQNYNALEQKKIFRNALVDRAKNEFTTLRVIYDEEANR